MALQRPTVGELVVEVEGDLAARLGLDTLLPRSVLSVLARTLAGAVDGNYSAIATTARQILPDTADAEHLERWASIYDLTRKAAAKAGGTTRFTGTDATTIPNGTRIRRVDGVLYETRADVTIAAGIADAPVVAEEGGLATNATAGTTLSLVSPILGVDSASTVQAPGLTGGAEREDDADLLVRLLARLQTPPQGGAEADYVLWALEIAEVTRAWALPLHLGEGTVGVTFVLDDHPSSIIPDSAKLDEVEAYIESLRPATATVTVFAPATLDLDPEIELLPDTAAIRTAVEASLEDMLRAQVEPGKTLPISKVREAISAADGEVDHVLVAPVADIPVAAGEIQTLGTITWA